MRSVGPIAVGVPHGPGRSVGFILGSIWTRLDSTRLGGLIADITSWQVTCRRRRRSNLTKERRK